MRFSDLDGARIGVWGAGVETRNFAGHRLARLPHSRITVVVLEVPTDAPELTEGALVVGPEQAVEQLSRCDVLVRSPGVSIHRPEVRKLRAAGLPTVTPTGLWLAQRKGRRVLGVTATKGKSTTATLAVHLARAAGVEARLVGNIGTAALDLLDEPSDVPVVAELSSYQIADLAVGPEVAAVLNLYQEHLNWHLTFETYREDKLRLLRLPGVRCCVLNAGSPTIMSAASSCRERLTFGNPEGWNVREDGVARGEELVIAKDNLPLLGAHNALNLCAALTTLDAMGLPLPDLPKALEDFRPLPHRLETVHEHRGILWVDDSISTTPESTECAVASFPDRDIVLVGGGEDRGQDYTSLARVLVDRRALVLGLPTTGGRLVKAVNAAGSPRPAELMPDLPSAVAAARRAAQPGSVVLLSPAAPSYNVYRNFEARGDHFSALARGDSLEITPSS